LHAFFIKKIITKKWELLWIANNLRDHSIFRASLPRHVITSAYKKIPCYSGKCQGDHNMTLRYMQCTAEECDLCKVHYRTIDCEKTRSYYAYKQLDAEHSYDEFNKKDYCNNQTWQRGIPDHVKLAIEYLMFEKDISKPYRIHVNLQSQFNQKKIFHLPTSQQIQNFLYSQRRAIGKKMKHFFTSR
jgi:hypothetical protein